MSVTKAAETPIVAFQLAQALPAVSLPAVAEPSKPAVEPSGVVGRRAFDASRVIATTGRRAADLRTGWASSAVMWTGIMGGTFAAFPFVIGALGVLSGQHEAANAALYGGAAIAAGVGLFSTNAWATRAIVDRRLTKNLKHEIADLEKAGSSRDELTKAWAAARAKAIAAVLIDGDFRSTGRISRLLAPHLADGRFLRRLNAIADKAAACSDAARAEARLLEEIEQLVYARVYRDAGSVVGPATPRWGIDGNLELIMSKIEKLTSAGRALLPASLRDTVVTAMGDNPANRWRVRRFLETCDGDIKAYAQAPELNVEIRMDAATRERLDKERWAILFDLGEAAQLLASLFVTSDEKSLNVASDIAEPLAAFWEERGYRAKLSQTEAACVKVTVYGPDDPPVPKENHW